MSGGATSPAPGRPRGRPKGSTNRRSKDLKGYIDAKFGGSAAQQSAALAMVTPGELKRAGGSMAKAQVNKALELVRHVRDARDRLDGELRDLVLLALEELLAVHGLADAKGQRALVTAFIQRVNHLGGEFGLREAMTLLGAERAALLPYTDQRQPLAVEIAGERAPAVIVMGGGLERQALASPTDIAGDFRVLEPEVSRLKSHDQGQAIEGADLFAPQPADGK